MDCHWTTIGVHGSVIDSAFGGYQSDPLEGTPLTDQQLEQISLSRTISQNKT